MQVTRQNPDVYKYEKQRGSGNRNCISSVCCYKSCLIIHTSGGNNCLNLPLVIRYGVDNFTLCYVTSNAIDHRVFSKSLQLCLCRYKLNSYYLN